jgi:large subunit ribosomal protein L30e
MSNVPVIKYPGKSIDLGRAVRKPFFVSTIVIIDPGESRILELAEQKEGS